MTADAVHDHVNRIDVGQSITWCIAERSGLKFGIVMQCQTEIRPRETGEQAIGEHGPRATDPFLCRLANDDQCAVPLVLIMGKNAPNADGAAQADFFLSVADPGPQDLLALDFEENAGDTMTLAQPAQFVTEVRNRTGRYPGFYSDSLAGGLLGESVNETLRQCWLWRAEYGPAPVVPPTWPTWTLWQYTDGQSGEMPYAVPGVGGTGSCDRSKFNGDIDALARLWGIAAMPPHLIPKSGHRWTLPAS